MRTQLLSVLILIFLPFITAEEEQFKDLDVTIKIRCSFKMVFEDTEVNLKSSKVKCNKQRNKNTKVEDYEIKSEESDNVFTISMTVKKTGKAILREASLQLGRSTTTTHQPTTSTTAGPSAVECPIGYSTVCTTGRDHSCPSHLSLVCPSAGNHTQTSLAASCSCLPTRQVEQALEKGVSPLGSCYQGCACLLPQLVECSAGGEPAGKKGCVEDGDCDDGQVCSAEDACIAQERMTCAGGGGDHVDGVNVTMDCYIKQCNTASNVSWIPLTPDKSCCSFNQSLVPNGWKGVSLTDGGKETTNPVSCSDGSLTISESYIEEKVISEEPSDQKDMDSMVGWYTNNCINRNQLLRSKDLQGYLTEKDESCLDKPPESNGESLQYFFDGESCQQVRVDLKRINTGNIFSTTDQCEMACMSPCLQTVKNSRSGKYCNTNNKGERYYFDGQICQPFSYHGCEINRNNFKNEEECQFMCLNEYRAEYIVTPVDKNANETDSQCKKIEKQLPELETIVKKLENVETVSEGLDNLENISSSPGSKERLLFIYLFLMNRKYKYLRWATVTSGDCQTIEVQIRYSCAIMPWSPVEIVTFNNICNNLIPQGLIRHYQTDYMYGTETYNLVIVPVRTSSSRSSKMYLIGTDEDAVWGWAHNFIYIPVYLYVNEAGIIHPGRIGYLAAHELGHDVLFAGRSNTVIGWLWSASHKGTSTVFTQLTLPTAPVYPGPGPEIDVMFYFNGEPSPAALNYGITLLAGEDARTLVERAGLNFLGNCGGAKCGSCLFGACQPGLFCNFFGKCTECNSNGDCPADQYCAFKKLTCKECRTRKPNGAWCLKDAECINFCHLGLCTECEADNDCPLDQYCENLHNPGVTNVCSPRQGNGAWCDRDRACMQFCHLSRCTECRNDNDCPATEYCRNMMYPGITNECAPGKPNGAVCLRERECANFCDGGRCAECEQHGHCPAGQYCRWRNTAGVVNRCQNVCNKLCAVKGNCGHNGSPCDRCIWGKCKT